MSIPKADELEQHDMGEFETWDPPRRPSFIGQALLVGIALYGTGGQEVAPHVQPAAEEVAQFVVDTCSTDGSTCTWDFDEKGRLTVSLYTAAVDDPNRRPAPHNSGTYQAAATFSSAEADPGQVVTLELDQQPNEYEDQSPDDLTLKWRKEGQEWRVVLQGDDAYCAWGTRSLDAQGGAPFADQLLGFAGRVISEASLDFGQDIVPLPQVGRPAMVHDRTDYTLTPGKCPL